jgi:uncharacterized protein YecE (DUF72 family)
VTPSTVPLGARTCVGTAGWSLPAEWQPRFPAEGTHLERYASVFGAVEINSSFYRPHRERTYETWAASSWPPPRPPSTSSCPARSR